MRKAIQLAIAGAVLSAAASVSAGSNSIETVVVPLGSATIKVVEIGLPPAKQKLATDSRSGK